MFGSAPAGVRVPVISPHPSRLPVSSPPNLSGSARWVSAFPSALHPRARGGHPGHGRALSLPCSRGDASCPARPPSPRLPVLLVLRAGVLGLPASAPPRRPRAPPPARPLPEHLASSPASWLASVPWQCLHRGWGHEWLSTAPAGRASVGTQSVFYLSVVSLTPVARQCPPHSLSSEQSLTTHMHTHTHTHK